MTSFSPPNPTRKITRILSTSKLASSEYHLHCGEYPPTTTAVKLAERGLTSDRVNGTSFGISVLSNGA